MQHGRIVAAIRQMNDGGYLCAEAFPWPNPAEAARQTVRAFKYWRQR